MGTAAVLVVIVFAIVAVIGKSKLLAADGKLTAEDYLPQNALLSQGELAFQAALKKAVTAQTSVSYKVRLADVVTVSSELKGPKWAAAFNRIQSKHIDFVLCDSVSTKIICAIELNDKSHHLKSREARDQFVRTVLARAKIPFLEVRAARAYNPVEIRERIQAAIAS